MNVGVIADELAAFHVVSGLHVNINNNLINSLYTMARLIGW